MSGGNDGDGSISWAKVVQWGIAAAQALMLLALSQAWKHEQIQDELLTDLRVDVAATTANRFTVADGVQLERSCRAYADSRPHPVVDLERRLSRLETSLDRCCGRSPLPQGL